MIARLKVMSTMCALALLIGAVSLSAVQDRPGLTIEKLAESMMDRFNTAGVVPPEWETPPRLSMSYKVTTYVGAKTTFPVRVEQVGSRLLSYAFDFDGDGQIDYHSGISLDAEHEYIAAGDYVATLYVVDTYGQTYSADIAVHVLPGKGTPALEETPFRPSFQRPSVKRAQVVGAQTDTARNHFFLLAEGNMFWCSVVDAYHYLTDSFGYSDDDIMLCAGANGSYNMSWCLDDTLLIDHSSWVSGVDSAMGEIMASMTANYNLFIVHASHGGGWTTEDAATYGDTPTYQPYEVAFGYTVNVPNLVLQPGNRDLDRTEAEFKMRFYYNSGLCNDSVGMYQWAGRWEGDFECAYRHKIVAHFPRTWFDNWQASVSDTDFYIEEIYQYLKGDNDDDGFVDPGYDFDYDGDGNLPIDTSGGHYVYDEDDWGHRHLYSDHYHGETWQLPQQYRAVWFDAGNDSTADYDAFCQNPESPVVDGSDTQKKGCLFGVDFNGDGDKTDSVGTDEYVDGFGLDDNLGIFLDSLSYAHVAYVGCACYGGGVIDDMSRPHVLIMTTTTAGTIGNLAPLTYMCKFLSGGISAGGDNIVTFREAFNALETDPYGSTSVDGRERLDDNGDQNGHVYPLPNGGDGYLADSLWWGVLSPPAPVPTCVLPAANDTIIDDITPTFFWSDTGSCDSFEVMWGGVAVMGEYSAVTADTTFTAPNGQGVNWVPSFDAMGYYWKVRSWRARARSQWTTNSHFDVAPNDTCCNGDGIRGDANLSGSVTIGDVTLLIDFLYVTQGQLPCWTEANVNGSENEIPTVSDISQLTNYLFGTGDPPPDSCD